MKLGPRRLGLTLLGLALVILGVLSWLLFGLRSPQSLSGGLDVSDPGAALRTVTVYYLEPDTLVLRGEPRQIADGDGVRGLIGELVASLGRSGAGFRAPLPEGTHLLHYFEQTSAAGGEIVLDFNSVLETWEGASLREEQLRFTALARTLAENLGRGGRVRLLVEGRPLSRWGRHMRLDAVIELEDWL
jgi:hypothetical protein